MWKTLNLNPNYQINEKGELFNIKTKRYLQGSLDKDGYKIYSIMIPDGIHHKNVKAHRLVAEAFIPNPNSLPEVNHKDRNKLNNNVTNLEWISHNDNMEHWRQTEDFATKVPLNSDRPSMLNKGKCPVGQYTLDGVLIAQYESYTQAQKQTGIRSGNISLVARGKRHTAGGFIWKDIESSTTIESIKK